MTIETGIKAGEKLKTTLDQVVDLLNKQDLVSELTSRQATPRHELLQSLLVKQQLAGGGSRSSTPQTSRLYWKDYRSAVATSCGVSCVPRRGAPCS